MIVFWIAAALLSAAAAALVVHFAARGPQGAGVDPAVAVYRRHLIDVDEQHQRGLLTETEHAAAHAEVARRLIGASDAAPEAEPTKGARMAVAGAALVTAIAAAGIYAFIGQPGRPDEPFARRAAPWIAQLERLKSGESRDINLPPEQLVVALKAIVKDDPENFGPLFLLGQYQVRSGQQQLGIHNLRKAAALSPQTADVWSELGQALVGVSGEDQTVTPEAKAAFEKAVALDSNSMVSRYYLGRAALAAGDVPGGLGYWRAISAELQADDPKKSVIDGEIARAVKAGGLPGPEPSPVQTAENQDMIQAMVASLAAKLKENPNDQAGWARLIRSYAVLGDTAKMNAALEEARRIFKDKPSARAALEAAAEKPQ